MSFQFGPGWATFGLALQRGFATKGVQVGTWPTQTDVKTRWADGSIKFCIPTLKVPTAGAAQIIAADLLGGGPPAVSWPQAVVTLTVSGLPYRAVLPSAPAAGNVWLSGPLVRESRVVIAPTISSTPLTKAVRPKMKAKAAPKAAARIDYSEDRLARLYGAADVAHPAHALGWGEQPAPAPMHPMPRALAADAHPSLQVIFDVRSYDGGGHRVDVTVQNVRDSKASVKVTYDVSITVDNVTVFSRTGLTQACRTRWRKVFPAQGFAAATVVPDFESAYASGQLLRFLPSVVDQRRSIDGESWDPLRFGEMQPNMGSPGGRPDIAPYPWWVAQYLVNKKPDQLAYMLRCADLAGSWSGYLMKEDGVSTIRLDERPNYYLSGPAPDGPSDGEITYQIDPTHAPSLSFVPYLVTGDRYYLDTQKAWANYFMLQTYTGPAYAFGADVGGLRSDRSYGVGSLAPHVIEPRGFGWPIREKVFAASITPDDDPDQLYFQVCLKTDLKWSEDYGNRPAQGFFNMPFADFDPENLHKGYASQSLWQSSFVAIALWMARQHGFGPGDSLMTRIAACCIKLLTNPDIPFEYGASVYYARYGEFTGYVAGVPGTGVHRWFQSGKEFFEANYNPRVIDSLDFDPSLSGIKPLSPGYILGYYDADYRMLCQIGVRLGLPGAATALAKLETFSNGAVIGDVSWRSGWAVDLLSGTLGIQEPAPEPAPVPVPVPAPVPVPVPVPVTPSPRAFELTAIILTANEIDDNHGNNTITASFEPVAAPAPPPPVVKKAALRIEKAVAEPKPIVGTPAVTTFTLTNDGPDEATGVTVKLLNTKAVPYVSVVPSRGTFTNGLWTLGAPVAVGAAETLIVTATA